MKPKMVKTFLSVSILSASLAACQNAEIQAPTSAKQSTTQQKADALPAEYVKQDVFIKNVQDKRQYKYLTLENGLRVALVSDPELKTAAAALTVGVGSYQDPDNFLGLAHYLEHMIYQSSKKYPAENDFMKFISANAGGGNASTSATSTNYYFRVNADAFDGALDRLGAAIAEPVFDPDFSERERQAVNSEWSRNLNNPGYDIYAASQQLLNPAHPGSRFYIGNLVTLKDQPGKTLNQALWDYYNQYYSANIMTLTLIGKDSVDELAAKAKTYFSAIKNKQIERPGIKVDAFTQAQLGKEINVKIPQDTNFLRLQIALEHSEHSKYSHAGKFILRQLNRHDKTALLGSLLAAGYTQDAGCSYEEKAYGVQDMVHCHFNLTEKGDANKQGVITAFFNYIDLLKTQGVTAEYIAEYEHILQNQRQRFSDNQPLQFAVKLSNVLQEHKPEYALLPNQYYKGFDKERVEQILAQITADNMIVKHIGKDVAADMPIPYAKHTYSVKALAPYKPVENLAFTLQIPPAEVATTKQPELITKAAEINYPKPTQILNQDGVTAHLATSQHFAEENKAITAVYFESPATAASAKNMLLNHMVSNLFQKQTLLLSENAKLMDAVNLNVRGTATSFSYFLIDGKLEHQKKYFTEVLAEFRDLKIDQQKFDNLKTDFIKSYKDKDKAAPSAQAFDRFREIYKLFAEIYTVDEKLAALETMTLADLKAFHQTLLKGQLQIYSMSNMNKQQLTELAMTGRNILGKTTQTEMDYSSDYKPKIGKKINVTKSMPANDVLLYVGFVSPDKTQKTKTNLAVLNRFMGPAIFNELRTKQQLGYGVHSFNSEVHNYATQGFLIQSNNTDLNQVYNKVLSFVQDYKAELEQLNDEQIAQSIDAIVKNIKDKPSNLKAEFSQYQYEWRDHKWAFDNKEKFLAALQNVNKASLIKTYNELLLEGKHEQFAIQYRGENFKDTDFAKLKSLSEVESQGQQTAAR